MNPSTVKVRNVGFGFNPALITGKIDAALGAFWNYEGVDLRLRGKRPRIIRIEKAGVPTYNELVLVANEDALEADADKIRAFIGAVSRGTRALRRDPSMGIEGLLKANPDLDPKLQRASVAVTLPLFFPPEGKPFGWQDPGAVGRVLRLDEGEPAARERAGPGSVVQERPAAGRRALTQLLLPLPFGCGTILM